VKDSFKQSVGYALILINGVVGDSLIFGIEDILEIFAV
jgi:hypothetical protein